MTKRTLKIILVGWKHRRHAYSSYRQMKLPVGELKKLTPYKEQKYSYQEVLDACVEVMRNEINHSYFKNSHLKLGNFYNVEFENFNNEDKGHVIFGE